jgi:hypothetical protein
LSSSVSGSRIKTPAPGLVKGRQLRRPHLLLSLCAFDRPTDKLVSLSCRRSSFWSTLCLARHFLLLQSTAFRLTDIDRLRLVNIDRLRLVNTGRPCLITVATLLASISASRQHLRFSRLTPLLACSYSHKDAASCLLQELFRTHSLGHSDPATYNYPQFASLRGPNTTESKVESALCGPFFLSRLGCELYFLKALYSR